MSATRAGESVYPLMIRLRPSRALTVGALVLHGGAALALLGMSLPWWASIAGLLAVGVSARQSWRGQRAKAGLALELFSDGMLAVREKHADDAGGVMQPASPVSGVVVFPLAVWFTLPRQTADGHSRPIRRMRLMLIESEVGAEWKMLRTWLRHRAPAAAPAAANKPLPAPQPLQKRAPASKSA
jgi:hypothetical protein